MALPLVVFGATGLLLVLGWRYAVRLADAEAERDTRVQASSRARAIGSSIKYLLTTGDRDRIRAIIAEWATERDARHALVVENRDTIIAATTLPLVGQSVASPGLGQGPLGDTTLTRRIQLALEDGRDLIDTTPGLTALQAFHPLTVPPRPGDPGNARSALLFLEYDLLAPRARARAAVDDHARIVAGLLLLATLGAAFALHFMVSRRLWRLEQAVNRRAAGDRTAVSGVRGGDEIGQVAEAFDAMTAQLGTSQAMLSESQATLETFIQHAPEAVAIYDVDTGRFVDANHNAELLFELGRAELQDRSVTDVSSPRQPNGTGSTDAAAERLAQAIEGSGAPFEWIHRNASGEDIPCEIRLVRLPVAGRRLVRASITDIRERKATQATLLRSQKLESVGRLAGGVAHDFNNLLSIVLTSTEMGQRLTAPTSPLGAKLAEIKEAAHRGAALTRQLLAFAGHQIVEPRPVDLNETTRALSRLLERLIGDDITLVLRLAPESWFTRVDPGQLEQVIVNLAVNARDAMPTGGTLTIETANVTLDKPPMGLRPGEYLELTVRDTGVGFGEDVRDRIFEPFFTTKDKSKGTGLGLATCYGIATAAGGTIVAESAPGKGAKFTVLLPRTMERPPELAAQPAPAPPPAAASKRILVVEDERRLRPVVAMALEEEGYHVLAAGDATEALALVQDGSPLDGLVTDVVMPGTSGRELAGILQTRFPGLRVLYTSGYDDEQLQRYGGLDAGVAFLQKPYSLNTLIDRVGQLFV